MLTITGEVRKVIPDDYIKDGKTVSRFILIVEPDNQSQNYEIQFTPAQCEAQLHKQWEKMKGKKASIEVSIYINHQYKFHKYTAVSGMPI